MWRHDLDVANCAIELCKAEGEKLDRRLGRVDSSDIRNELNVISRRILGKVRGSHLFDIGDISSCDLSPMQQIWVLHLLSRITTEFRTRERRQQARVRCIYLKNQIAEKEHRAPNT